MLVVVRYSGSTELDELSTSRPLNHISKLFMLSDLVSSQMPGDFSGLIGITNLTGIPHG